MLEITPQTAPGPWENIKSGVRQGTETAVLVVAGVPVIIGLVILQGVNDLLGGPSETSPHHQAGK